MNKSVAFFDRQFRQPASDAALKLNPFEELALPYLHGEMLDFGCGMGNLAFAAAHRGCVVTALDASPAAVSHVRARAAKEAVAVQAGLADLRDYRLVGNYDCIVAIGLLMFFDCRTAMRQLAALQAHVRPGGCAVVNVLIEGTTYLDMFDPGEHCLFAPAELVNRFAGWRIERSEISDFEAAGRQLKRFATVVACKPPALAA
jgi:tellurite methyltransferase